MGFIVGLLTFVLVLNCVVLTFLVLIQLPKKEAGVGLAFGSAASDALFGAGSGTVLTKITKYSATIFFILALLLAVLERSYHNENSSQFMQNLAKPPKPIPGEVAPPPSKTTPTPVTAPAGTNFQLSPMTPATTNATATPSAAIKAPESQAAPEATGKTAPAKTAPAPAAVAPKAAADTATAATAAAAAAVTNLAPGHSSSSATNTVAGPSK